MGLLVERAVKRFGNVTAVDGVSFSVDQPGVFGLLGTNGAGKTTTIRMILGILERDGGSISWNGLPVSREAVRFGYLPEERGIYPKAKVGEQLLYFAALRGMSSGDARRAMAYWLERLKVAEYARRPAEQLSKGNQQKIQLICALIHDPELVVLDEPFSGLDPVNTDLFRSVIRELTDRGKYIILSSHQMATVEEFCRQIVMLKNGRTLLSGDLKQIKAGYGRRSLAIDCAGDLTSLAGELGIEVAGRTAYGWALKITQEEQAHRLLRRLLDEGLRIDRFEIREPTLHEIFIEKAGESGA